MKAYWTGVFGQVVAIAKRVMRDKMALFFTFLFPLIFLLVFGTIFNNQSASLKVAIINHSDSLFAKQFVDNAKKDGTSVLKVQDVSSMDEAREKMKHSQLDGIIELPKDFGKPGADRRPSGTINVLYAKGSDQAGGTLSAVMTQIVDGINRGMGQPEAPLKVVSQAVGDKALKTFDYTFTGLLAFSLMSMGIFGLANQMPTEKQKGAYRRLQAAPFTSGQLILATMIVYTLISLLSAVSMLLAGHLMFHFQIRGDWLTFSLFLALAAAMMVSLGLLIGSWAKNENQSSPLTNLVSFPMMFLSGAFFPSYLFPEWLQGITKFIPMTPVVDGLRLIMTENASLAAVGEQTLMVLGVTVVVYFISTRVFRWE